MPLNLFTLAYMMILASLTLLFLPDFILMSMQQMLFCNLMLVLTALCGYWFKKRWFFRFSICLNLIILALGYAHSFALDLRKQADEIEVKKQNLVFTIEEILHQQEYQTVIVRAELNSERGERRILLNWKADATPFLGDKWRGMVSIRPLSARLNFGGFDRQQWYFSKGIIATGTLKSAVKIDEDLSWREGKLQKALKQTENLSLQGLLIALAFGERAWLDKQTWSIYQQTNTAHLIAISGLHIGLAMGIGFLFGRSIQFFFPTRHIHPFFPLLLGGLFALIYAYLAGFTVPTFRAISALIFVSGIQMARRYYSSFQLFILVVAFLLVCDPLMPLSVSFWLSVGAVFCLIIWYRYVPFSLFQWQYRPFSAKVRWILGLFHLQFGLLVLFTPIQTLLFNGVAMNGFIANLIAVPLYSFFLVPLILFSVLTDGLFHSWWWANLLAERITELIGFFQGHWLTFSFHASLILAVFCCVIFICILYAIYREKSVEESSWRIKSGRYFTLNITKPLSMKQLTQLVSFPLMIILVCLSMMGWREIQKPTWQLDNLDVGQGLAVLIVKNGKAVLYDTGPAWQGGSMAELEVLPYLQREGIELEKVILSHDDNDHSGGISAILKAYPEVELLSSSEKNYGESHRSPCIFGQSWQWQGLNFEVLSPANLVPRADNGDSCVILLDDGQYRVLLTGDAEIKNEQNFARTLGKIDVLQVGHHGSKTSTGEFLLAQTRPDISVISSGRWNQWKFPHSSVVARLKQYQSEVENTAISGQIRLQFFEHQIKMQRARSDFSPWYAYPIGLSRE